MSSNLQFTIEERIQINDDQPPVHTFVSMEVKPNLKVDQAGENVTISGFLSVYGTYRSEEEQDSEELAPLITEEEEINQQLQQISRELPVSITIPSYRIKSLSELNADIESFDYHLHSPSDVSVNVTLAVTGINEEETAAPQQDEEEIVVVHRASHWNFARDDEHSYQPVNETIIEPASEPANGLFDNEQDVHPLAAEVEEQRPDNNDSQLEEYVSDEVSEEAAEPISVSLDYDETEEREPMQVQEAPVQEEVKVAITSKKAKQESNVAKPLSSFFAQPQSKPSEAVAQVEESQPSDGDYRSNDESKNSTPNTLDWKRMLIRDEKEQSFRSVKMVIINGNRTLEDIAQRYNVSTSKLIQMNNLESAELEEGQILYVPQS